MQGRSKSAAALGVALLLAGCASSSWGGSTPTVASSAAGYRILAPRSRVELRQAVADALTASYPTLVARLKASLASGRTQGLYDLQLFTDPVESYAAEVGDAGLSRQLTELYTVPLTSLDSKQRRWVDATPRGKGREVILDSAQLLYLVTRHARHLLARDGGHASSRDYLAAWWPVIVGHFERWAFEAGEERCFSVAAWGCGDRAAHSHEELLKLKRVHALGDQRSYCNAVTDVDLWIISLAAEMSMCNHLDAAQAPLSAELARRLPPYLGLGTSLIASRLTKLELTDLSGRPRDGLGFDHGAWDDHPDYARSGGHKVGWDLSHARRLVSMFTTMRDFQRLKGGDFPRPGALAAFADAVVAKTWDRDLARPRFASYLDGSNGYYRKVPPFGLSEAMATGGYGALGAYSHDMRQVSLALLRLVTSTDPEDQRFVEAWYPLARSSPALFALQLLPALQPALP